MNFNLKRNSWIATLFVTSLILSFKLDQQNQRMQAPTSTYVAPAPNTQLIENDTRFRCCCGCMTVRVGSIVFCALEIIGVFLSILGYTLATVNSTGVPTNNYYGIASAVVTLVVAILVLVAIKLENRYLIIPHLVWLVLDMAAVVIVGITAIALFTPVTTNNKDFAPSLTVLWIVFAGACLIRLAITIWIFWVLYRLYQYYKQLTTMKGY